MIIQAWLSSLPPTSHFDGRFVSLGIYFLGPYGRAPSDWRGCPSEVLDAPPRPPTLMAWLDTVDEECWLAHCDGCHAYAEGAVPAS
jgi:hypothetical protein